MNEFEDERLRADKRRRRRQLSIAAAVVLIGGTAFGLQAWRHSREEFKPHRPAPTTTTLSQKERNELCQEFPEFCVPDDGQLGEIPTP